MKITADFMALFAIAATASAVALPAANDNSGQLLPRQSDLERNFCLNPFNIPNCLAVKGHADEALARAQSMFPTSLHNGVGDAFRHCYWNARMTIDLSVDTAQTFANLHEDGAAGQPAEERSMDLSNNNSGRAIGVDEDAKGGTNQEKYGRAFTRCKNAATGGFLVTLQ
ncbi:MAG: hypothetical protein M1817_001872 [Caeruleum heppii]|nr:MAG: hypothetical protein M1817_001872 [Caeruleum heppii]